jgi:AraC-like DNA-binding protein
VTNREAKGDFESGFSFVDVGGLVFNRVRYSEANFKRAWHHIRGSADSPFVLHLILSGGESGLAGKHGEHQLEMRPDRIVLSDWAIPYVSKADATDQISVAIPRGFIENSELIAGKHPVVSWSLSTGPGRLLADALTGVWDTLPQLDAADGPKVAAGFMGLLNGLLTGPGKLPSDVVTLAMMKTCLRQHLHDPECGAQTLLNRFPHSRASIYRLFAPHGGVQNFVREERLRAAYAEIASGSSVGELIAKLAWKWGYSDASHFHRAFKRRFELTPGEVAESFTGQTPDGPQIGSIDAPPLEGSMETLHKWLGTAT